MDTSEVGSMRLAAVALLVLSVARWGLTFGAGADAAGGGEVLKALAVDETVAVEEGERARRPLGEDERIDPNRADVVELDRLPGVGAATARAIVAARDAGAVFRTPDDLESVRGLGPRTVERLRASLDFTRVPSNRPLGATRIVDRSARVDVNHASAGELVSLPGVGPVLAERIVAERRRGRFRDLDDLTRVPGVGLATVERLRGQAEAGPGQ